MFNGEKSNKYVYYNCNSKEKCASGCSAEWWKKNWDRKKKKVLTAHTHEKNTQQQNVRQYIIMGTRCTHCSFFIDVAHNMHIILVIFSLSTCKHKQKSSLEWTQTSFILTSGVFLCIVHQSMRCARSVELMISNVLCFIFALSNYTFSAFNRMNEWNSWTFINT